MDGIIEIITQFAAQEPAIFALIIGIIGAAVLSGVVNVGAMLVIWADRKVMSDFCNRFGPNRVGGRWGILQLGADAIKLFTKEDVIPKDVDKGVYVWAPIIASAGTMSRSASARLTTSRANIPDITAPPGFCKKTLTTNWWLPGSAVGTIWSMLPVNS